MMEVSNNMLEDKSILNLAELARKAKAEYDLKAEETERKMIEWLRDQMPVGTIINIKGTPKSDSPRPSYMLNVKVIRGTARGTGLFRLERIRSVELNTSHLQLSRWECDATPISEKTGNYMSAKPGNSRFSAEIVTLRGYIGRID